MTIAIRDRRCIAHPWQRLEPRILSGFEIGHCPRCEEDLIALGKELARELPPPLPAEALVMKRGKTEIETLKLNGWGVGTVLEGTESNDQGWSNTSRILITAMGEETFLCRWDYLKGNGWEPESGSATLSCREWRKVESSLPKLSVKASFTCFLADFKASRSK